MAGLRWPMTPPCCGGSGVVAVKRVIDVDGTPCRVVYLDECLTCKVTAAMARGGNPRAGR